MGIMGGEDYDYRRLEANRGHQCGKSTNGRHLLFMTYFQLSLILHWTFSKPYTEALLSRASKGLE